MEWTTAVELLLGALATADLAYKYGMPLLKKSESRMRGFKKNLSLGTQPLKKLALS